MGNRLNRVLISDREMESLKEAAVILDSHSVSQALEREPHLREWALQVADVLSDIVQPDRLIGRDFARYIKEGISE